MIIIPLKKQSLDFAREPLLFTQDQIILKRYVNKTTRDAAVMERWETPLLQRQIDLLDVKDKDVLEIGFGMGITANMIQNAKPKSHTIIDCHPQILNFATTFPYIDRINLVGDFWQNVIMGMDKFDRIFYDPYLDDYEAFFQVVELKLREDGIFSYFHWENFHKVESVYNVERYPFDTTRVYRDGYSKDITVKIPLYRKTPTSKFLKS